VTGLRELYDSREAGSLAPEPTQAISFSSSTRSSTTPSQGWPQ